MKKKIFEVMVVAVNFCSVLPTDADGLAFSDDFNRPDADVVGNGWTQCSGNSDGLKIRNNELTNLGINPEGPRSGIFRPVYQNAEVTVSARFKEMGSQSNRGRYVVAIAFRNDGSVGGGMEVRFERSGGGFGPSEINIFDGNTRLAPTINSSLSFGSEIEVSVTVQPNNRINGTVWHGAESFAFSTGPLSIASSGSNIAIISADLGPNTEQVFQRIADVVISTGPVSGSVDLGFNPIVTSPPTQVALAVQPDGKILLGGLFTAVNGQPRNGIARLNADGTLESTATFNPGSGANSWVNCFAVQTDGKILLGGLFTSVNGQPRRAIARLNPDGTVESTATFNPGSGMGGLGYVWSVAVQPDGKILIGGGFDSVDGQPRRGIARLNADGTVESTTTFNPGTGTDTGNSSNVVSMAVQTDGRILLAGDFTTINDQPRNHIGRLNADGTLESEATFNLGTGANASVQCVAVQADGKILLGGYFTSVNGQPRNHVARLNPDGSVEDAATFNPGTGIENSSGPVYTVLSMAVQTDGKILIAGEFTGVNGQSRNRIARLNPDGSLESTATFDPGTGANDIVYGVSVLPDGNILLAGAFTSVDGQPRQHIARLTNDSFSESLAIPSNARVQWFRSGAAPEVDQVSFDLSTNGGVNWSPLGSGTRVTGGWECAGLNLPASGTIRARGRTADSYHNGSSGLVESVASISAVFGGINDGLIAYYPFNGNANDESGNGHNGIAQGATITSDRFGNGSRAYSFNNLSSSIKVSNTFAMQDQQTIVVWVNPSTVVPKQPIFEKSVPGFGGEVDFEMFLENDGRATWFVNTDNGATGLFAAAVGRIAIPSGQWSCIAGVIDKSRNEIRLYVNGILDTSNSMGGRSVRNRNRPFRIGNGIGNQFSGYFHGKIDDVRIYDRSLSLLEIHSLFSPPLTITGAVSSSLGPVIAGAAIKLQRFGSVFWEGVSGTDGLFHSPPLLAQSFIVTVTKSGFTTLILNIEGETGGQRLLELVLRPAPPAPAIQTTARQATQNEKGTAPQPVVVPQGAPELQLKIFDGAGAFVPVEATGTKALRQNAMTVVMTHGWNSNPEVWALPLALRIKNNHGLATLPNITAWDWHKEADTLRPTPDPAPHQGRLLGEALRRRLGYDAYTQPIHFIGHSLGTIVNRYACDNAHQRGGENTGEIGFDPQLTRPHITLLDEAEVSTILQTNVITSATIGAIRAGWAGAVTSGAVAAYKDWKSPLPATPAAWIDNYISMVGIQRSETVNVCLIAPAIGYLSPVAAHAYSYQWYSNSVEAPGPSVGFRRGRETGGSFPPSGNGMTPGSLWYENLNQPMTLILNPDPTSLECNSLILGMYSLRMASAVVTVPGQKVLDGYEGAINFLGDKGGDLIIAGQHFTVVAKEKIGEGVDAAYDNARDFLNWINPVNNIRNLVSPDFRIQLQSPAQSPRAPRDADNEPAAWLTVNVPANAGLLQFDFTLTGTPASDRIVCAVGGENVFNLPAIYAPQGEVQSTDMIDISKYAGQQVELFFGLAGGTSADCELAIDGIRFITIPQPTLMAFDAGDHIELKWPAAATGWIPQTSTNISTNSWQDMSVATASAAQGVTTLGILKTEGKRFFRLRRFGN